VRLYGERCAGQLVAEEAHGGQEARERGSNSKYQRAQRTPVEERLVPISAAKVTHMVPWEDPFVETFDAEIAPYVATTQHLQIERIQHDGRSSSAESLQEVK
jgi:hypothetical protein